MDLELKLDIGSVNMVIGSVGCGKSSVLQAILGEMQKVDGRVEFAQNSRISYCAQQVWGSQHAVELRAVADGRCLSRPG